MTVLTPKNELGLLEHGLPKRQRRPPVAFEAVKAAFEELGQEGLPQTLENILGRVGGSKTTILRHLETLRAEGQPNVQVESSPVSPHVLKAVALDIARIVKERTGVLEGRLLEARSALKVLSQECETLQASVDEAEATGEVAKSSLAELSGVNRTLLEELRIKSELLTAAQADAEQVRQARVLCEAQLKAAEERSAHFECDANSLRHELSEERKRFAVAALATETVRGNVAALQAQLAAKQQVEEYLRAAAGEVGDLKQQLGASRQLLAATEAERTSLQERLIESKQAIALMQDQLAQVFDRMLQDKDVRQPLPESS